MQFLHLLIQIPNFKCHYVKVFENTIFTYSSSHFFTFATNIENKLKHFDFYYLKVFHLIFAKIMQSDKKVYIDFCQLKFDTITKSRKNMINLNILAAPSLNNIQEKSANL